MPFLTFTKTAGHSTGKTITLFAADEACARRSIAYETLWTLTGSDEPQDAQCPDCGVSGWNTKTGECAKPFQCCGYSDHGFQDMQAYEAEDEYAIRRRLGDF